MGSSHPGRAQTAPGDRGLGSRALGSKWPTVLSGDCLNLLRRVRIKLSTGEGGPPLSTLTKHIARVVSSFLALTVP